MKETSLRTALNTLTEPGDTLESADTAGWAFISAQTWLRGQNIVGFGIANRVTAGQREKELALKIYVERKLPRSALRPSRMVPVTLQVPGVSGDVPIDVEAVGKQHLDFAGSGRRRPLLPGYSVGLLSHDTGTLGCFVSLNRDREPKRRFALSNAHVLSNAGFAKKGSSIIQPGGVDGGTAKDKIGTLCATSRLKFSHQDYLNLVDAAIALVVGNDANLAIPHIGVPSGANYEVKRGMKIKKWGRTTGFTTSEVLDTDYRTFLTYDTPRGRKVAGFKNLAKATRYSDSGDSGSAILDAQDRVVGLHLCAQSGGSAFIKIRAVCDALGISIATR